MAMPRSASAGASSRKRYSIQCAEGITRSECAGRGRNQQIHRNPVTLVTPADRRRLPILSHDQRDRRRDDHGNRHSGLPDFSTSTPEGATAHAGYLAQSWKSRRPPNKVYNALNTLEGLSGWWTSDTQGDCKVDGVIQLRFGERGGFDMKVLALEPARRVLWQVAEGPEGMGRHQDKLGI